MRKKWILLLSLALLIVPAHAQEDDDLSLDDEVVEDVGGTDDIDVSDADFSDEEVNDSDFDLEPATQTAKSAPTPIPDTEAPPTLAEGMAFGDEPDLEYEAKLYDIYINYYATPMPDGEWNKLLAERTVESYKIQKGDNLWDISRTIFGDGNYWPKIWSINSKIRNPHLIEPQNTIRFILGDESGPPAFTVTEASAEADQEEEADESATSGPEPELPPPSVRSRPVVKRLPPSLPQWQDPTSSNSNFDITGIDYKRRKIADVIDAIPLSSYIAEEVPEALGHVVEVETGNKVAANLQYIYVTVKEGDIGDVFLAVQNRGPVQKTTPFIKDSFLGYGIEVLGEVQLVEKVSGQNERKNGALYRALVIKIVNPVQVGAILTKGKIEQVHLSEEGPRSQVVAQIIGGELFNQRQVYGPENIAFLNKGENHDLQVGHLLPIRANRKLRNPNSIVTGNVAAIGWLKIIKTTPRFSTAIVLRAWSDILTGDLTGAGEMSALSLSPTAPLDQPTQTSLLQELDDEGGGEGAAEEDSFDDADDEIGGEADFSEDEASEEDFDFE